jgi:hypothetical protein
MNTKLEILLTVNILAVCIGNSFSQIPGCTDKLALNYNSAATINDGSCQYNETIIGVLKSVELPEYLNETSGLIFWNDKIWTHNDDTDTKIYSFDPENISTIIDCNLKNVTNNDWEDISQDDDYLYIGDFGNNGTGNRTELKILRIAKNSICSQNILIDTINFKYSDQTDFNNAGSNNTDFDCEAFIVDSDSIFLFTKQWKSKKTSVYSLPKISGTYIAKLKDTYNINGLVTGATFIKNKNIIVLTAYTNLLQPYLVILYDYQKSDFFKGNKRQLLLNLPFHQIEGICSVSEYKYYISNEKRSQSGITIANKLHTIDIKEFLQHYVENHVSTSDYESESQIMVSPNPAFDSVNITFPSEMKNNSFTVYNIYGAPMINRVIKSAIESLDIKSYPKGIYFVKIADGNMRLFIKN